MITDNCAPENNFDNPNTEKNAALPATRSADRPTSDVKFLTFSSIYFSLYYSSSSNSTKPLTCVNRSTNLDN